MFKAILFATSLSITGVQKQADIGAIVNMDVCHDLVVLLNEGPQPDGKQVLFGCREKPQPATPKKIHVKDIAMQTTYTLIKHDGTREVVTVDLPKDPGYHALAEIIHPLLGPGRNLERVNVLHEGQYTDMFVDDSGMLHNLPVNEDATAIYRNNVLTHEPDTRAEDLDQIHGPAVLFSRKVWF